MSFYSFKGFVPVVHPTSFIHPQAVVTGNVIIGRDVYVGPGAALRGDWGKIEVRDGCNIQENCTIHMFPGTTVLLEEGAHVGHGAIIHGAILRKNCLIGMNSVIMDEAEIGENAIIGALSFVAAGVKINRQMLAVGNPAREIKPVSNEMVEWKSKGTRLYQLLPNEMQQYSSLCEPLTEIEPNRPEQEILYQTWNQLKK